MSSEDLVAEANRITDTSKELGLSIYELAADAILYLVAIGDGERFIEFISRGQKNEE